MLNLVISRNKNFVYLSRIYVSVFSTPKSPSSFTVLQTEVSRVSKRSACEGVKVVSLKHWPY